MITKLHLAPIICIIILLFADTSHSLTLDEVINRVQERYEKTRNFQADFTQTSILKTVKQKQISKGKVFIRKPGMMRWEYKEPEAQFIISDSKTIWFYVPSDKQVMISNVASDSDSHSPNTFLAGSGKLRDTFNIEFENEGEMSQSQYLLRLIPKKSQPNMTKLVIGVNSENFRIEMSSIYDIYGNQTIVSFSNIEINKELSEGIFHFEVPQGVRVVTQQ
ncbi:MAG: outer membrane lipoprotein chaperone LolA [Nitrospinae bacterium]|nr:outer membrane lipoprotein chaperone LolA [Nitrospinota bacterium]